MPQSRIALIMGGGVSLGSFSAGALARVVRLLEHVERGPAKIDVVTGASAGSMTLAILLYHLFRGSPPEEVEGALRSAWVDRIEFEALRPAVATHGEASLLSDRIVREIAGSVLDFTRWADRPAHPYFAEGTLVSFALTNMNGIAVRAEGQMIRQAGAAGGAVEGPQSVFADAVQTTFHDDVIRFALHREAPPEGVAAGGRVLRPWTDEASRSEWRLFREAAVASGAFPAAFPPVRLPRRRAEYAIWPDELDGDEFGFDYVDGGVLRNEPLREAIHLAGLRDEGQDVERIFFFVDPNISGTRERYALPYNQALRVKAASGGAAAMSVESPSYMARLTGVLARLVGVLASQAAFRDWLRAARVNSQIEWRDELAELIGELAIAPGSPVEQRFDGLLERIYAEKARRGVGAGEVVDRERIRRRVAEDLAARAEGGPIDGRTKLLLLIDLVANLREKRKINLVAITPASTADGRPLPIAGDFLSNFGGFFSGDYRAFDYAAGEYAASEVMNAGIAGARPLLKPGAPRVARPAAPDADPGYRTLPESVRRSLEGLVGEHAHQLGAMIGIPGVLRGVVATIARAKVRSGLSADRPAGEAAFLLELTGGRDLSLRGAPGCPDGPADGAGVIRTVVAVRRLRGERGAGEDRYAFTGPNVLTDGDGDGTGRMEVREKRVLRPSRLRWAITLDGPAEEWFRRARLAAVPIVRIRLEGEPAIRCAPDRLVDDPVVLADG